MLKNKYQKEDIIICVGWSEFVMDFGFDNYIVFMKYKTENRIEI